MPDLQALLQQSAALHSHLCPRQVLGVRTGMYAAQLLGLDLPQTGKRVFAFVETDGCYTDGVAVATGCWLGRRTMRLVDYGKAAATFVDTHTGRAVRITPSSNSRALAELYAPGAESPWHAQLAAYQRMPTCELLLARLVELTVSMQEIISKPGLRATCQACGEDVMNGREVVREGVTLCRMCAGVGGYYR